MFFTKKVQCNYFNQDYSIKIGFDLDINKITSVDLFRNGFKYTYKDKPRYVITNDYKYVLRLCTKLAEIIK